MAFEQDKAAVRAAMARDPAFMGLAVTDALAAMDAMQDRDAFLLAAMRAMALAGNGHSRVIPNAAIRVCPVRIVSRGAGFAMRRGDAWVPIETVNGRPGSELFAGLRPGLAGTAQRQRVIGAILLAWPAALGAETVTYGLPGSTLTFTASDLVSATALYPVGETGMRRPEQDDFALPGGEVLVWTNAAWHLRMADMRKVDPERMRAAAEEILSRPRAGLVVDLRGNAGGDFTRALPLIDSLRGRYHGRLAALVDRFTFSAAIVTALLLQHHLGARLYGEEMGDGLRFWAEGDLDLLPDTGAHLRWSDGWHDWATGRATDHTPPEIARHMVSVGAAEIVGPAEAAAAWVAG